jgi:HD-GYP domain-containing protein (c-di-GMP phosphodiesterase class II)/DNA-binding CsgD family transcriptional regulator
MADLLGGLSIVADMGFGLPPQEAMRTSVVSTALARRMDLSIEDVRDAFYVPLLMHVGCISMAHETAAAFGDELALTRAISLTDLGDPEDLGLTLLPELTRGMERAEIARVVQYTVAHGIEFGRRFDSASCEVARATARRIGLPEGTQRGLYEASEFWGGGSAPQGLHGDDIALAARVAKVAEDGVFFFGLGGADRAVAAVVKRAGGVLDPAIVDVFVAHVDELLGEIGPDAGDPRDLLLEVEPEPVLACGPRDMTGVAAAFADLSDLKSPYFHGHATEVTRLAVGAARRVGLDAMAVERLEIAALLHDVGRVGISNAIWEKPGPLTRAEWEQVRMHAYHSERVLATSAGLEPMATMVGMHHERLDGSGYHRCSRGRDIGPEARILAAADAFAALVRPRAHRAALPPAAAARELTDAARAGRFDRDAVTAVLDEAGRPARRRPGDLWPAGLSGREVEVLGLLAQGHSNRDIAERLFISRRTAEHHVQHVYAKIGASTRAGAALFAVEHDLLPKSPLGASLE